MPGRRFANSQGCGMGEPISGTNDKILKIVFII